MPSSCAQTAALRPRPGCNGLGETDRYAGEQAQYNALYAELAVWLRQNYPPRSRAQWRW